MPKRRKRAGEEGSFRALANWTELKPGREVLITEYVDEPRNWQILGAFHDSPHAPSPPILSHAVTRLRDVPRNRVTRVYEWWLPGGLANPNELTAIFYAHELEPLLRERGLKKGLATVKEIFALRVADDQDADFLQIPVDDKFLEVMREYFDSEGHLVLILRQLLGTDQMTGTERSLRGVEMEGRLEW
jgi:hypothetical protein